MRRTNLKVGKSELNIHKLTRLQYTINMLSKIYVKNNEKIAITSTLTVLIGAVLGFVVFNGHYFQNWYNSPYTVEIHFLIIGWLVLFGLFGVCFYLLWQLSDSKNYIILFILQFANFAIHLISVYCFAAYILALTSSLLSLIFSIWTGISVLCKRRYLISTLMLILTLLTLYCVFFSTIFCSLEYGIWKN